MDFCDLRMDPGRYSERPYVPVQPTPITDVCLLRDYDLTLYNNSILPQSLAVSSPSLSRKPPSCQIQE